MQHRNNTECNENNSKISIKTTLSPPICNSKISTETTPGATINNKTLQVQFTTLCVTTAIHTYNSYQLLPEKTRCTLNSRENLLNSFLARKYSIKFPSLKLDQVKITNKLYVKIRNSWKLKISLLVETRLH